MCRFVVMFLDLPDAVAAFRIDPAICYNVSQSSVDRQTSEI